MNAVEIEEAVSKLAEAAFDAAEFPFAFLEAFGNKPATIKQLRSGHSNKSDVDGGLLQRNRMLPAWPSLPNDNGLHVGRL
jgi:hypothetical protein